MKYKFILFILFVSGAYFSGIQAQVKQVTIIDELEKNVPGEGVVQIISDPKITELIGLLSPEVSIAKDNFVKTNGFRVQVFMSNDPRTARKEVSEKGSLVKTFFPEIPIYEGYVPPNWKLLVGDFLTKEEADVFRQKLQKSIPGLGKEMYVVSDKINIPIHKNN